MTDKITKPYPGLPDSDLAVVCGERVYSFFATPDLRTLQPGKTYAMGVVDIVDELGRSGYTFYETDLDLSDASWGDVTHNAQEDGVMVWAALVKSNVLTDTGGTLVIGSRLHNNNRQLQFVYDNTNGTMVITPINKE